VRSATTRERKISGLGEIRGAAAGHGEIERSGAQKITQTPPPLLWFEWPRWGRGAKLPTSKMQLKKASSRIPL